MIVFWLGFLMGGVAGLGLGMIAADNFRYPALYVIGCTFGNATLVGGLAHLVAQTFR